MDNEEIVYGVQAVMYYSGNGGCEADWFCSRCPFLKTFCDRREIDGELVTSPDILSGKAEEWMRAKGIDNPWEWKASKQE